MALTAYEGGVTWSPRENGALWMHSRLAGENHVIYVPADPDISAFVVSARYVWTHVLRAPPDSTVTIRCSTSGSAGR